MNNFKSSGPGGLRGRREFIGGRPSSDANYGPKKSFAKKSFGGNNHGGDRGGFGGNNRGGGERRQVEMHKATCSNCGKPCEVPFRPDGSKPVLCSDCFGKSRSDDLGGFEKRDRFSNDRPQRAPERKFDAPRAERGPSPDMKALQQQIASLESKMHEMLSLLQGTPTKKPSAKREAVRIPAGEIVTVVSDIKKAPKSKAEPKATVVKKTVVKKASAKKVAKKK